MYSRQAGVLVVLAQIASAALLLAPAVAAQSARETAPRLFRAPSLSDSLIAFRYADDIWTVPRTGGAAHRLTSTADVVAGPFFSPDGHIVAYSAHHGGETDAYTVPVDGGTPRRLTFQPDGTTVLGWTPDGTELLIASIMHSVRLYPEVFRIRADGSGLPERLPLPSASALALSPDGNHAAYNPFGQWQAASWKRYRGGQTQPVWIVDLKSLALEKVPRENSNDTNPVWLGESVFFLSDRGAPGAGPRAAAPVSLFRYDPKSRSVTEVVHNRGLDLKTLTGHGDTLAYEQFGTIHLVDAKSGTEHAVAITTDGDLPALEPHMQKIAAREIQNVGISPTGVRAVFEAHGEIFTVPAEKGDVRNLTSTSDAAEREPAWSPDGQTIACLSDATGEYGLYLRDQAGLKPPRVIPLGPDPTYFYAPRWSPDGKHLTLADKRLNLWLIDVDSGHRVRIDADLREGFSPASFNASFSPDSKWVLYTRSLPSLEEAAFLYELSTGKSTQITDGMSNVTNPVWDAGGKYIFFAASTDIGPARDAFGLGSLNRTTTSTAYVTVLSKKDPSPIPPESDEEKSKSASGGAPSPADTAKTDEKQDAAKTSGKEDKDKDKKDAAPPVVTVDLDGIQQRTLALPIPARNYTTLVPGTTGVLLLGEGGAAANPASEDSSDLRSVWRFTLESRKTEDVLHGAGGILTSADGQKLLYRKGDGWWIAAGSDLTPAAADGTPGKPLHVDAMVAKIDPRAEFHQIYNETWRIEREFFYDPGFHGLDLGKIAAKYRPYVDGLSTRSDLTYLQQEMLGEITVGHMFISSPPSDDDNQPKTGLLGADYSMDHDRYKFAHVVSGGNWNPLLYSPLTQPGVNVKAGEYLLAVNGVELHAHENLYAAFQGMAGRQVTLRVGPSADGKDAREVIVVPVATERPMREQEWIEANIRKVDAMTGGEIAYVYLPNTAGQGFTNFNRYFFAQTQKKAVIIDERFNQGGDIADYVIDVLKRTPMLNYESRQGLRVTEPSGAVFGPKAMLINQNAGSGGDAMPWLFRQAKLGPLIGTRTWGGLVGIGGYPSLLDGGGVTAPRTALYGLHGEFEVENIGVAPDIEVEETPQAVAGDHDPQLERAVTEVKDELRRNPPQQYAVPPYPNYHKDDGLGH